MDNETKRYIDSKFAEAAQQKHESRVQTLMSFKQRERLTKKFIYLCAGILSLLVLILVGLLAWAQFIPHNR